MPGVSSRGDEKSVMATAVAGHAECRGVHVKRLVLLCEFHLNKKQNKKHFKSPSEQPDSP